MPSLTSAKSKAASQASANFDLFGFRKFSYETYHRHYFRIAHHG